MLTSYAGSVSPDGTWFMDTGTGLESEMDLHFGLPGDVYVAGRWNSSIQGSHPAVVRPAGNGLLDWFLDLDGDADHELSFQFGLPGDIPIVGDWDGDGFDNIGVVRNIGGVNTFLLNLDTDPDAELQFGFGVAGQIPIITDIDGDGILNAGAVRTGPGNLLYWDFDLDGDAGVEQTIQFGLPGDIPVAADFNGDGVGDLAVVRQEGAFTHWYFDTNRDSVVDDDFIFGLAGYTPVAGNWLFPEVKVNQSGVGEIFSSNTADFGIVEPGLQPQLTFTLTNNGTDDLQIDSLTVSSPAFEISNGLPSTLAAGSSNVFRVRYLGNTPGESMGEVRFVTDDHNESPFIINVMAELGEPLIEVRIQDEVVPNQLSTPFDFGRGAVNNLEPTRRVQITNTGTSPLQLDDFILTGDFELIGTLPSSLVPGAIAQFEVRMPTDVLGTKSGVLRINAPVSGDYDRDGDADGADFLSWQRNFGTAVSPDGSGADGNGDGLVNSDDLGVWKDNYGAPAITLTDLSVEIPLQGVVGLPSNLPSQPGVARGTQWFLDIDGDPDSEINLVYGGLPGQEPVAGRWLGGSDSYPGVVVPQGDGLLHWLLDTNGDPAAELDLAFGLPGDTPIVGDWDGNGTDDVGTVRYISGQANVFLNTDDDPEPEFSFVFDFFDETYTPVVVDIDGDGILNIGAARAESDGFLHWQFDLDGDADSELDFIFGLAGDTPVTGDWDRNGVGDVGAVRPEGGLTRWYYDTDRDPEPEATQLYGLVGDRHFSGNWTFPELRVQADGFDVFDGISTIHFGTHPEGEQPTKTFTITNTGNETLTLGPVSAAGDVFGFEVSAQPNNSTLEPGESTQFSVDFTATRPGPALSTVTFFNSDGSENPFTFLVSGRRPAADLSVVANGQELFGNFFGSNESIDLGPVALGASLSPTVVTVSNNGDGTLELGNVILTGSGFTVVNDNVSGQEIAPSGVPLTFELLLDTSSAGFKSSDFSFSVNDPEYNPPRPTPGGPLGSFRSVIQANVAAIQPEVRVFVGASSTGDEIFDNAAAVMLGSISQAAALATPYVFAVVNDGNATLNLQQPTASGDFIIQSGFNSLSVPPGAERTFAIRLNTSSTGSKSGTIQFLNNDSGESPFNFLAHASVVQSAPEIEVFVDGNSLTDGEGTVVIGSVTPNAAQPSKIFTVKNSGNTSLSISTPIDGSSRFTTTTIGSWPSSLSPGQEVQFRVTLLTNVTGIHNANVRIMNDDSNENPFDIPVRGVVDNDVVLPGDPQLEYYFSFSESRTISDSFEHFSFDSNDIVRLQINSDGTHQYTMALDGGIRNLTILTPFGESSDGINALDVLSNGDFVISTSGTTNAQPGVGNAISNDLLRFDISTNTWSLFFDGSEVGLFGNDTNIDAVDVQPDGSLLLSFTGSITFPILAKHEDIVRFTPNSTGDYSSGTWTMFVNGDQAGINPPSINVNAYSRLDTSGLSYLSTSSFANIGGVGGLENDVFSGQVNGSTNVAWSSELALTGGSVGLSTPVSGAIDLTALAVKSLSSPLLASNSVSSALIDAAISSLWHESKKPIKAIGQHSSIAVQFPVARFTQAPELIQFAKSTTQPEKHSTEIESPDTDNNSWLTDDLLELVFGQQ